MMLRLSQHGSKVDMGSLSLRRLRLYRTERRSPRSEILGTSDSQAKNDSNIISTLLVHRATVLDGPAHSQSFFLYVSITSKCPKLLLMKH